MAATTHRRIDRRRVKELTEREEARLNERTPASRAMFERARRVLSDGVASSYQLRAIYLERGDGPRVWDVDGNEMVDFHNGFGSMIQGHAPRDRAGGDGALRAGHALRGADRARDRGRRGPRAPLRPAALALHERPPARRLHGGDRALRPPGSALGVGSKGCVTFSPQKIVDYETFKETQDAELADLAWLFNMNRGIFMTPGREEEWTLSATHTDESVDRYVAVFEEMARELTA